jgi:hypothetical protein
MNFTLIRSKKDLIVALIPQAADAVHPHGPRVAINAYIDLLIADVVKEISAGITDRSLSKKTLQLSKIMAEQASTSMVESWEPGDSICPPWWPWWNHLPPWPGPHGPHSLAEFDGSNPLWKSVRAAEQIELANMLTQFAGMTTSKEFNIQLKSLATGIARASVRSMVDDFERCGTVPRKPFPLPKRSPRAPAFERVTRWSVTPVGVG